MKHTSEFRSVGNAAPKRLRSLVCLCLGLAVWQGGLDRCSAQDAMAGAATMGAGLSIAMEKAQELIRKGKSAGNDLLLQAGLDVQNAISATEAAYARSLEKTISSLNDSERRAYMDVENLFKKASSEVEERSAEIRRDAKLIAMILPMAGRFPQVGGIQPSYAAPDSAHYPVEIDGLFRYASKKDRRPELEFNGKRFAAVEATTTRLRFDLPTAEFGADSTNGILVSGAKLHVPWDSSSVLNPFSHFEDGVFTLQLAKLPKTPGSLVIYHEVERTRTEESSRRSGSFHYDSHADDIEENRSLDLNNEDMKAGWRIVPHSGYFILDRHIEGDEGHDWYNKGLQAENDRSVVWRARTEHKGFGSSGKIIWGIGAKVTRVVHEKVQVPEEVQLTWGMQKVFAFPAGKWKAVWKRFDGAEREYRSTDLKSAFFKIDASSDSLTIATYTAGSN